MLITKQIELVEKNVKPDILIFPDMEKHLRIYSMLLKNNCEKNNTLIAGNHMW